jgi:hypothetical protein
MTGVEILAMQEVVVEYAFDLNVYFFALFVTCIVVTLLNIVLTTYPGAEDVVIGLIVGAILGAIVGVLPASYSTPIAYETQYKVTISDEVLMNDFLEKYEIIDQEGKIYTVRERE